MKPGDHVQVKTKKETIKGILMPQQGSFVVIKLKNGYNMGIDKKKVVKIKKIKSGKGIGKIKTKKVKQKKDLPKVTFIATGGTIGTHVDYKTGGVFMCRTPEEILATTPKLANIINIKTLSPFTTASEDMSIDNYKKLAKLIADELNSGAQGVILTHGTDTLHYTSAVLSFMLEDLNKPVAVVGAQRSPDRGSFDGKMNLICAAHFCKSDFAGVAIVMHGSSSDEFCYAIRGTKCRKMHTSRRDAFRPINELPLAKIWTDGKIKIINENFDKRSDKKVVAKTKFEKKVAIVKVFPGSDPSIIDWYIKNGYKGLVIEGTALGHVPTGESGTKAGKFNKKMSWIPYIKKAIDKGLVVVMASTTLYGRIHPFVYRNLRLAHDTGMIYGEKLPSDMLPEVAYVKLGWVLGQTKDCEKAKEMMIKNLRGEITKRSDAKSFLF
ncbi:MAG: Glutamyl-tRNA(Gln) amidotransferase subunit D [Candidatus Woesearchaeota archaeon]|nr:Glutamyl-tRNA(Gln) amidotransferase subunit D [Candidatus Woesearchaeota archaeon]